MLIERTLCPSFIFVLNELIKDGEIAGFLDIRRNAQHQPKRIIVEITAHIVVAALGQGLILVVGTPVLELGGRQVQDALTRPLRYHLYESILTAHVSLGIQPDDDLIYSYF